jgi:hypothetical protein
MFDGTLNETVERRRKLISALRGEMPEGFEWDFSVILDKGDCGTAGCALGLAYFVLPEFARLVGETPGSIILNYFSVGRFFGLDKSQIDRIFYNHDLFYGCKYDITPRMVADALEATLKDARCEPT